MGCIESAAVPCDDGRTCPAGTVCDDLHVQCVDPKQLTACAGAENQAECSAPGAAVGLCHDQVCLPAVCGDGFLFGDEVCDGDQFEKSNCTELGFYDDVALQCNDACGYDDSVCTGFCGDGAVNGSELCDGAPPTEFCVDIGYAAGWLDCAMCGPGLDDCKFLGWKQTIFPVAHFDVHGTAEDDVFAVGGQITHYDGKLWSAYDISACLTANDHLVFSSVWMHARGTAVAIAGDKTANVSVAIHITPTNCTRTQISGINPNIKAVWAASANDVYAAGTGGLGIYHHDGTAWTQVFNTGDVSAIWGSGPNDIYAASGTTLLHSTGGAFTPVSAGITGTVADVWGDGPTNVFVSSFVGGAAPSSAIHHFTGTWSQVYAANSGVGMFGACADGNSFASPSGRVLSYDGTEWLNLGAPPGGAAGGRVNPLPLYATSGGIVFAADSGALHIYRGGILDDSAVALTNTVLRVGSGNFAALFANGGNDFYLWNGTAWTEDTTAPGLLLDMWIDPATNDIYAIQNITNPGVWKRPAGQAWSGTPVIADRGNHIWAVAANDFWIAQNDDQLMTAELRHWNGAPGATLTCTTPDCSLPSRVDKIWGSASDDVYVGGFAMLRRWNGSVWSDVQNALPATSTVLTIGGTAADDVYIGDETGRLAHFDGSTWTPVLQLPGVIHSIWAFDRGDVFVGGAGGQLWHYDGNHWYPVRTDTFNAITSLMGAGDVLFAGQTTGAVLRLIRTTAW